MSMRWLTDSRYNPRPWFPLKVDDYEALARERMDKAAYDY
jgi:hypothetical protein